jgi:outer membrane protein TolC
MQVIASAARLETAVSPEIDSLRAEVERQSAEQRLRNATNQLDKDKLTLGRITGLAIDREFVLTDSLAYIPPK